MSVRFPQAPLCCYGPTSATHPGSGHPLAARLCYGETKSIWQLPSWDVVLHSAIYARLHGACPGVLPSDCSSISSNCAAPPTGPAFLQALAGTSYCRAEQSPRRARSPHSLCSPSCDNVAASSPVNCSYVSIPLPQCSTTIQDLTG